MTIFGYYFESYYLYIVLVLPCVIWAMIAQIRVQSAYGKFSRVRTARGLTGAETAEKILRSQGITNVAVAPCRGHLSDHYDPRTNTVFLSEGVYGSNSVAACGIAAHECGHAIQHATGYAPLRLRAALIPITNLGSNLAMPLVLIGLLLSSFSYDSDVGFYIAFAGVICFATATVFQLVTLPVEFNASRRALSVLESQGSVSLEEKSGVRKVLWAAAMTYVAALFVSLANLLRILILVMGGRNRRR